MNRSTTRALLATLFLGTTAIAAAGLTTFTPAHAAAAGTETKNKALVDALNGAQADYKAGRFADALAKAKVADSIKEDKPQAINLAIHGMIVKYALDAKDYASALAQIDKNIAANEGNKTENIKQAMGISFLMKDNAKAKQYSDQLGGNLDNETRLFIASQMAAAGQNKEALAYAAPALQGSPSEAALKFQQAVYFKMNDAVGRRAALEQLVTSYPKPEYWHDLLQLARNEKGLNDEQTMDIYRLRNALGDLKTVDDYFDATQEALVAGYPAEAKAILDKGVMAKVVPMGERLTRLYKKISDDTAANAAVQADLQKRAAADPNAKVKLGLIYWSFAKNKEAEESIRAGIAGGKLTDPEGAKVALGHALFAQGKKPEAIAAFDSVARNSKQAAIARLWSIYSRKG
jgi:hypothetical protein